MKFLVRQFYVVEVEVEAEDPSHAREIAGFHETAYEIETRFIDSGQIGGPDIGRAAIDDEVLFLEDKPEDRPSPTYVSARESAIDAQAAEYGDMDD